MSSGAIGGTVRRVIDDAIAVCTVPAPTFAEGTRARLVMRLLHQAGARPRLDGAGNVVAAFGSGPPDQTLILTAHLDTVFDEATEISPTERRGRLAAPGIGDNSIAVAALVHLARRLSGAALRRPVTLAATVGEEGLGDLRGAKALLADEVCGAFVAVEGMMLDSIAVAAIGSLRLRATVRGPGGHPWSDRGTPSAVHGLLAPLQAALERAERGGVVANAGVLRGGTAINVIAAEATVELDLRSEDGARLREVAAEVRAAFELTAPQLSVKLAQIGDRPGGQIAADAELLAAARAAREQIGLPPADEKASSTDANAAHGLGIPALTIGITTGANAHRLDEYIDLKPIAAGLAALDALVDRFAAAPGSETRNRDAR
ncbi:MAG: M20/M25/M40 family metallo-hydrolase [Solirubrobacteraceae bacterium]